MRWPMDSDELRCPNCGSPEVRITFDYRPGRWAPGQAYCLYCGAGFKFTFTEEEEPAEPGQPAGGG